MKPVRLSLAAVAALALGPALAATTFYDDPVAFHAARVSTLKADFEAFSNVVDTPGIANPYTEGGVNFSNPSNLYVAAAGGAADLADIDFPFSSNVLTVSGNEIITMSFAAGTVAVGFDSFTNYSDAPVVTVYDTGGMLIGSYVLAQGINSAGFVGVVSSVSIGRLVWTATDGGIKDTAIDNVVTGMVPEPTTYALMLLGLTAVAAAARQRPVRR
jgi:hypothetical protein